jgi:transposase
MDIEKLLNELEEGRLNSQKAISILRAALKALGAANARIQELEERIAELEKKQTTKLDEPFSVDAEEKRQEQRGKTRKRRKRPTRTGRRSTADKLDLAERHEFVYPEGVDPSSCFYSHSRVVWRLIDGRAVLVAYHIYQRGQQRGRVPFVLPRSEFGLEFVLAIAYMVYVMGISFEKACKLLGFLQGLSLSKGQANSLMNQLARAWEAEFETLCTLLAHAAVVHADETSWSIKSVWAFLSEHFVVCLFGVNKDGATLAELLDKEFFQGTLISDDAAVYQNFTKAQKCWAHLLRKAIKLTLQDPQNEVYRYFADALLALYRKACRIKNDRRLTASTRESKVSDLDEELVDLCSPRWFDESPTPDELENCFRCLVDELMRLMVKEELFTFVTEPGVDGTNNEAERALRPMAQARVTGRTNKTVTGCRRQTVIYSVLISLGKYLREFSLTAVVEEVNRWWRRGKSCFQELAESQGLSSPKTSVLDKVILPDSS